MTKELKSFGAGTMVLDEMEAIAIYDNLMTALTRITNAGKSYTNEVVAGLLADLVKELDHDEANFVNGVLAYLGKINGKDYIQGN